MQRRSFLKYSIAGAIGCGLGWNNSLAMVQNSTESIETQQEVKISPPVLQNPSDTGVSVLWAISAPATGWIEYGESEAFGQRASGQVDGLLPYGIRFLRVRLEGLKPGRIYHYRLQTAPVEFKTSYNIRRGPTITSPVYTFKTLDPSAASGTFTVWNDTHQHAETLKKLIGGLSEHASDLLFWNGDIFNDIPSEQSLIEGLLHPASLEYAARQPVCVVRGNHDTRGAGARRLTDVVALPQGQFFYIIRQGPIAFLILDTGEDKPDDHRAYGGLADFASYHVQQRAWLKEAIRQPAFRKARFRVLLTHIPVFTSKEYVWADLLAKARLDFAISGHTHEWGYYKPDADRPYPLLIGGGPRPSNATYIQGEASRRELIVRAFSLERQQLGEWKIPA